MADGNGEMVESRYRQWLAYADSMSRGAVVTCLALIAAAAFAPAAQRRQPTTSAPVSRYEIVRIYPHDRNAFTQGLVFADDILYEGTGRNGLSNIRKVKLENGEVLQQQKLESQYFGEGIALVGNSLIQLTWQSQVGFVYDKNTFVRTKTFNYTGEGWGLTYDGSRLIMSDGTPTLRFLDPETLKQVETLEVRDGGRPVDDLNELEVVKGEIFANIWTEDRIARIDPKTGTVTGWIDLTGLLDPHDKTGVDVLNGIAYDAAKDRLFVTGKLWPKLFEIRLK
jgi:glutaminyl-peptide cyclotransferase